MPAKTVCLFALLLCARGFLPALDWPDMVFHAGAGYYLFPGQPLASTFPGLRLGAAAAWARGPGSAELGLETGLSPLEVVIDGEDGPVGAALVPVGIRAGYGIPLGKRLKLSAFASGGGLFFLGGQIRNASPYLGGYVLAEYALMQPWKMTAYLGGGMEALFEAAGAIGLPSVGAGIRWTVGDKQEAARQEAARQKAVRQEAARQEAARQEAARQEAARQEAARQEAARQEAARQEAARQEAARQEAERQEAARQEAARQEAARQEAARQEAARQEAARQEAARQEAARQEAERQEAARQEAARQEAARQEAARQEAARQEAARQEAARQEAARQEAARQEAARQEAARQEAARQEAARQEAERQEAARQEAARQEAERQAAERQAATRQFTVRPGDTLSSISRQVYGRASLWERIYQANKHKLPESDNPDLILPDMVLDIPEQEIQEIREER